VYWKVESRHVFKTNTHTHTHTQRIILTALRKSTTLIIFKAFYVSSSFKMKYSNFVSNTLVRSWLLLQFPCCCTGHGVLQNRPPWLQDHHCPDLMCMDALHILVMKAIWTHGDKDGLLHVTDVPVKQVQMNSEAEGWHFEQLLQQWKSSIYRI